MEEGWRRPLRGAAWLLLPMLGTEVGFRTCKPGSPVSWGVLAERGILWKSGSVASDCFHDGKGQGKCE